MADMCNTRTEMTEQIVSRDAAGELAGTVSDTDGSDSLTFALVSGTAAGTITIAADGSYTFIPGTAFQGLDSGTGTIEGKYFNEIVRNLRRHNHGTALAQALDWMSKMHGFLSSPSGGGVRHGTQLSADVSPSLKEAHLYCNLTRSYINYLLAEIAELR